MSAAEKFKLPDVDSNNILLMLYDNSVCLSVCLSACLSVCLSVYVGMLVCLFVCPTVITFADVICEQ